MEIFRGIDDTRIATPSVATLGVFDGLTDLHGLELVRTVAEPNVTHLKFVRR